jgi:GNAT superfamily N-acetyltransferase
MPDMLARLYDLPDGKPYFERARKADLCVRRADPWDRPRMREFTRAHFGDLWSVEADRCFNHTPITGYLGLQDSEIVGFAVYECTRRGYFGPTGVREDMRGGGLGAALLFRCLESMREMGYGYAIIGGVGPAEFYEKTVGATVIPGSEVGVYGSLYGLQGSESRGSD